MGRRACCSKEEGMNRGAWTAVEDRILSDYIKAHGEGKWRNIPKEAGLKRCGKSCRLRWMNYLRPDIKRGNISPDEQDLIIRLHKLLGNRWSLIAGRLPGRTDNEIKNYWNTHLSKKSKKDPPPPKPKSNPAAAAAAKLVTEHHVKKHENKKSSSASASSCVVRTKASRCKEVFIIDSRINTNAGIMRQPQISVVANSADHSNNIVVNDVVPPGGGADSSSECYSDEGSSLIISHNDALISSSLDFMADISTTASAAGDISTLSELILSSDFTNQFEAHDQQQLPQALSCLSPHQEILMDQHSWSTAATHDHDHDHDHLQLNLDSDFGSLVAFLESADDWFV